MLDVVLIQSEIRLLIVIAESVLKTDTLVRHVFENITYFRTEIQAFGIDFRSPKIGGQSVSIRVKIELTGLLFIIHIPKIYKRNPTRFRICILPSVNNIQLFAQRIVHKAIIVHIVFGHTSITVNKQTGRPFIGYFFIEMGIQLKTTSVVAISIYKEWNIAYRFD